MALILRNPHSVLAALQSRPQDVQSITLPTHRGGADLGEAWGAVESLASAKKIPIQSQSRPQGPGAPDRRDAGRPKRPEFEEKEGRAGVAEATVK